MVQSLSLLWIVASFAQTPEELARAADPNAIVFIANPEASEGAPPADHAGKLVVVTDLTDDDPYFAVVKEVEATKKPSATLRCAAREFASLRESFAKELPEYAIVVTRPDHLDVNQHFALVEMLTTLDTDPFSDVAFGYLTGATPEEALAFAKRTLDPERQALRAKPELLEFGPALQGPQHGGPLPHPVAFSVKRWFDIHGPVAELKTRADSFRGKDVVFAAGHGLPSGVDDGLQASDLRTVPFDFDGAIYVSGPCYCGVTGDWFDLRSGRVAKQTVAPIDSFALAVLARGASALLAGFDPDRAEQAYQELEHLWIHADSLGHATKATYDGGVLAMRLPRLALHRYQDGGERPFRDLTQMMIGGGVGRALFGDPTRRPWSKPLEAPFGKVTTKADGKALKLTWSVAIPPRASWNLSDVYRCDGTWTHRIQFREEIAPELAHSLNHFSVESVRTVKGKGKDLEYLYPTAMIERWLGKTYLHVYLVFPPAGQNNVFFVESFIEAKFEFGKLDEAPPR